MKFISLRWKISGILFITNLLVGLLLVFFISAQVRQNLGTELIAKGEIIAQNLAQFAIEQIVEEDQVGLKQLISGSISFESVEYILIQKEDLTVLADTYNGQVPKELLEQTVPDFEVNKEPKPLTLQKNNIDVFDIWNPVEEGYLGYVRVGIRQDYVQKKIRQTAVKIISIIVITVLISWLLIIFLISNKVIKPLMYLMNRADEISQGKLEQQITLKTGDEIELLGDALERLRESVKIALDRLKKHQTMRM